MTPRCNPRNKCEAGNGANTAHCHAKRCRLKLHDQTKIQHPSKGNKNIPIIIGLIIFSINNIACKRLPEYGVFGQFNTVSG